MNTRARLYQHIAGIGLLLNLATAQQDWKWSPSDLREINKRQQAASFEAALGHEWHVVRSDDYTVYSEINSRFSAECSLYMDKARAIISKLLNKKRRLKAEAKVFVFKSQEHFSRFSKWTSRGFYDPNRHALFTFVEKPSERNFQNFYHGILLHEGTHQLLQEQVGLVPTPSWFTEGLANYFQLWDPFQDYEANAKLREQRGTTNYLFFRASLAHKTFLSVEELMKLTHREWAADNFGPATQGQYAAAETLFVAMMSDTKGRHIFDQLLKDITKGRGDRIKVRSKDLQLLQERSDAVKAQLRLRVHR